MNRIRSNNRRNRVGPARLWLRLWRDLAPSERRRLKVAGIAVLVGSAVTALIPFLVAVFVDAVIKRGHVVGLSHASGPLLLLMACMLLMSAMNIVQHQQIHTVTTAFTASMRQRIYAALLRWDLARFVDDARGAIYGRANRSIEGAERLIKLGAAELLPAVLVTIFAVILAALRYGVLGLVMAAVVPTGFALVRWQIHSQNGIRVHVAKAKERIDGDVSAWLAGLDVIRTAGVEKFFNSRIRSRCVTLSQLELKHHIAMSQFDAAKAVNEALWLTATLVFAIASHIVSSPGDLAGVVLLYLALTRPLRELHRVIDEASESALQTHNLQDDLAAPHDESYLFSTARGHACESLAAGANTCPVAAPAIELRDVVFRYSGRSDPVLNGMTTSISTGERVGVVGASGCGKSTLLKLLARLTHGYAGEILVQGRPIRSISRDELVDMVGYVGQRPLLFQGTVRENLILGRPGIGDEDAVQACIRANIHETILAMPDAYDTLIGEEGARLSGGQSQRLCLARALVQTPPIMLLDEPTSALDGPSQAVVQRAIDGLKDITMVVVAHRLGTLRTMDRILVMRQGRVVEEGTYDELVEGGGLFTQLLAAERLPA
ncbi:MAG TPA: ABC transporter ATP-binding protein [Actinomycetota bacterium]